MIQAKFQRTQDLTRRKLGFTTLPAEKPVPTVTPQASDEQDQPDTEGSPEPSSSDDDKVMRDLHTLLLGTEVVEGKMVCGNCGHEYKIREGIANFLLPSHLGEWIYYCICLFRIGSESACY